MALLWLGVAGASLGGPERAREQLDSAERILSTLDHADRFLDILLVNRGHLELSRARGPEAAGATIRKRLEAARAAPRFARSYDLRMAVRVLEKAAAPRLGPSLGGTPPDELRTKLSAGLVVATDGRWFERKGIAERVDLSRRGSLHRILDALTTSRMASPGRALDLEVRMQAGWPGERISFGSARARVSSSVKRLRNAGLSDLLITRDDGYLLDPEAAVARAAGGSGR
jgi:hypothetical protein